MNKLLQEQIEKHFGSADTLHTDIKEFIEDLNKILPDEFDQSIDLAQRAKQNLQIILDSMPFGVTVIDMQQKVLHANRTALNLMGYESETEILGRACHDTLCPAEKDKCPILNLNQTLDRSERILVTKDGGNIPIMKSAVPIVLDGNNVLLEAFVDIREQKRLTDEQQLSFERRGKYVQFANEITRQISTANSVGALFFNVVTQIKEKFDFHHVQVLRYNPSGNDLTVVVEYGTNTEPIEKPDSSIEMGKGPVGQAAVNRETILVSSQDNILGFPESKYELAIPLFLGESLIGVLDIHSKDNIIDPDVQLILEAISGQIAIIFESISLRTEMEDRLQELISLQQSTSIEGWQSYQKLEKVDATRFTFDKSLGAVIPIPADAHSEFLSAQNEKVYTNPLSIRGQVIGAIEIEDSLERPLSNEEKTLLESITNEVAEALERARLLETSQRSAAELSVLNEMGNAFSEAFDEHSIAEGIFTYASKLMEIHQFYVAFYDEEKDEISFPMVFNQGEKITEEHPSWDFWKPRPAGDSLSGYIIKSRRPLLIENNAEEVLGEMGLPFLRTGNLTQSLLAVPLAMGDNIIGMVSTQSEEIPGLYNQHHLELLTSIASQASVAINNARLFQQEQERAEQERLVRTITDKVWRGADRQTIMRVALEELGKVLNADTSTIQLGTREQLLAKRVTSNNKEDHSPGN